MGRIGSTKLVLPKWHKYGTYNRHLRVPKLSNIEVGIESCFEIYSFKPRKLYWLLSCCIFSKNRNAWSFSTVPRTQYENNIWFFALQLKNWQTPRHLIMLYLTWNHAKQYDYYVYICWISAQKQKFYTYLKQIILLPIYFNNILTYLGIYVFISVRIFC